MWHRPGTCGYVLHIGACFGRAGDGGAASRLAPLLSPIGANWRRAAPPQPHGTLVAGGLGTQRSCTVWHDPHT
jgi:hypothetical protein